MLWIKLSVGMIAVGVLTACTSSSGPSGSPLPTDGRKMKDIYYDAADDEVVHPDARVEELCAGLTSREARKRCQRDADQLGLVRASDERKKNEALGAKRMPEQPKPLYVDYNRSAANELKNLFPRLPNPDITIYVYPHLATRHEVPIPGYTTVMPLYQKVQYALPGERTEQNVR